MSTQDKTKNTLTTQEKRAIKRVFDYLQIANDDLVSIVNKHDKVAEAKFKITEAIEAIGLVWRYQKCLDKIPSEANE